MNADLEPEVHEKSEEYSQSTCEGHGNDDLRKRRAAEDVIVKEVKEESNQKRQGSFILLIEMKVTHSIQTIQNQKK